MRCCTPWLTLLAVAATRLSAVVCGEPASARPALDEHTVLLLRLDEGQGNTTTDASASALVGEIHGAQWNVGRWGYGLAFDGSGAYFDVPNAPKLCPKDAITVEAWLRLDQPSADVICKNSSYFMRIQGCLKAYFHVDGKWRILTGSAAIEQRRWTHVAMTYDRASRTMRTFIDGVLDGEKKLDRLHTYALTPSGGPLRVGRNTWRVDGGVVGKVDEVRISDVARTFEPIPRGPAQIGETYVPNGSFEFGRYRWRGSSESNSRLLWRLDSSTATHGHWSLRSTTDQAVTIITKPIPFAPGPDYVLSADFKADAEGRKGTLRIQSTHQAKRTHVHRRSKRFTVGKQWQTVTLRVTKTQPWQSGYVYVLIAKRDGTLWIDNVRLRRADAPAADGVAADAVGVRLLTGRLGDTFFANTGQQAVQAQVVNASAKPRQLTVTSQLVDFFGRRSAPRDHGSFALAAYQAKPLPFTIDTARRGPCRIDFTLAGGPQPRTMSYRCNVIVPLEGVGHAASSPFGMNTHMEREPNEHLACNLEMLAQCGVKWIRAWWGWGMAEKEPGQFDWTEFDRQYALVAKKQMQIMPILQRYYPQYEHAWAGLVDRIHRPPYKLEQWGGFVFQTVSRFRGRIHAWEIWNEPGYSMGFTPELYAQLCKVTYAQARRADPKCKLVGFAGVELPFMEKAANAGALAAMDIVSEHSYSALTRPESAMPKRCDDVRALLAKHGKPMPIWHTEQGLGADGDGYVAGLPTEEDCAASLVRGYVCALAAGVEKFFWFSSQTSPTYGWAVFYEDYVPRPRLVAFNAMASLLEGATFRQRVPLGDDAAAYVFDKRGDAVAVTWNLMQPAALTLTSAPGPLRIVDIMGNVEAQAGPGETVRVRLRPDAPAYLVFVDTKAAAAATALQAARLTQTPFCSIEVAPARAGVVEVRVTNRAPHAIDALVTLASDPPAVFAPARRFLLDIQPGQPAAATFRYAPGPKAVQRTVTVSVQTGPFRLQAIHASKRMAL